MSRHPWLRWATLPNRLGRVRDAKLLILTVPDCSWLAKFTLMSGLFVLSLFRAAASMVTPLQRWGLAPTRIASSIMLPIVSASFILSWFSSTLELPQQDEATSGRRTAVI